MCRHLGGIQITCQTRKARPLCTRRWYPQSPGLRQRHLGLHLSSRLAGACPLKLPVAPGHLPSRCLGSSRTPGLETCHRAIVSHALRELMMTIPRFSACLSLLSPRKRGNTLAVLLSRPRLSACLRLRKTFICLPLSCSY